MGILDLVLAQNRAAADRQPPAPQVPQTTVQFDYSGLTVGREDLKGTTPALVSTFESFCRTLQGGIRADVMRAIVGFQFEDDSSKKKPVGEILVTIPVKEDMKKTGNPEPTKFNPDPRFEIKAKKDPEGIFTFKQLIWD